MNREEAIAKCEFILDEQAMGMRSYLDLLPDVKRRALVAIFAWTLKARQIVTRTSDSAAHVDTERQALLRATEAAINKLDTGDDPVIVALKDSSSSFRFKLDHFKSILRGLDQRARGVRFESEEELREHCQCLAGALGMQCVNVCEAKDKRAPALAAERCIAFYLVDRLNDLRAECEAGEVFLSQEALREQGLSIDQMRKPPDPVRWERFLRQQIDKAETSYQKSIPLKDMIAVDCRPALWAITENYVKLIAMMKAEPARLLRRSRLKVGPVARKAITVKARWRLKRTKKQHS